MKIICVVKEAYLDANKNKIDIKRATFRFERNCDSAFDPFDFKLTADFNAYEIGKTYEMKIEEWG